MSFHSQRIPPQGSVEEELDEVEPLDDEEDVLIGGELDDDDVLVEADDDDDVLLDGNGSDIQLPSRTIYEIATPPGFRPP